MIMTKTRVLSILMITCLLIGMLAGCGSKSSAPSKEETIRIGLVYPLTGSLAKLGQEELKGVKIATDQINAAGGINGKKVELVQADAPTPDAAVAETERLITVEKVKVIMGSYSSGIAYAGSAVAEKNKVIWWENSGVADNITQRGFKYLFRFGITGGKLGESQALMIEEFVAPRLGKDPKDLKIALIYEDSAYGTSVAAGCEAQAKKDGLNIVIKEGYSASTTDLSSLILKMKQAGADVMAPTTYVADALLLFKQMKELGYNPPAVVMGANSVQDLKDALGDDINGLMHSDLTQPRTNEAAAKGLEAYIAEYKKIHNAEPWSAHSIRAYAGANVLFDVLKRANAYDPDKIAEAARATDIPLYGTPAGWGVKFDSSGQNERAMCFGCVWDKGNPTTCWPEQAAWPGVEIKIPWRQ